MVHFWASRFVFMPCCAVFINLAGCAISVGHGTGSHISDRGQVTGQDSELRAFVWDAATGMTDLGTLGSDPMSGGVDINEAGQVTGLSYAADGTSRAFLWDPAEGMQELGTLPGGYRSVATDINRSGQVVGSISTFANERYSVHAVLWDRDNGTQDLGTLGGSTSFATALNDNGQVIGRSELGDGSFNSHAFLWDAASGMQDLGTLGGNDSDAVAINNAGQIAGVSSNEAFNAHAFFWDPLRGMQDLGTLGGDTYSRAVAINNRGQVLGSSNEHAFLWEASTGMQDLGAFSPMDINETGQIAGVSPLCGKAILWDPQNGTRYVGRRLGIAFDGELSNGFVVDLNNDGQVLAVAIRGAFLNRHQEVFVFE